MRQIYIAKMPTEPVDQCPVQNILAPKGCPQQGLFGIVGRFNRVF